MTTREKAAFLGAIEKTDMTHKQARALLTIASMPGCTNDQLAVCLDVGPSFASELAAQVFRKGMIQRAPKRGWDISPDGARLICAWEKGQTTFPK